MKEIKFIKDLEKMIPCKKGIIKGIGDDTAVLPFTKDKYLLYASDMIVEDVHFKADDAPEKIGWKAVAVNISDIAAMAGVPKYVTVSAGLTKNKSLSYRKRIFNGIKKICDKFNVTIVGGDTCASEKMVIDVSIIGEVDKKKVVYRSGAKLGDIVFITGVLGYGKEKHLSFIPKLKESQVLSSKFKINSMMDISDGLYMDMTRLCAASKKGCLLYKDKIPVSRKPNSFDDACSYGEDFELLFTVGKIEAGKIEKYLSENNKIKVYNIGEILEEKHGLWMVERSGKKTKIKPKGYEHIKR
ncbi:MAG: thiamine-phosphate kinase [Candidatus Omnitrophica bacterium]|nr:thiamine-phosphate kinase [Candidatus Omnitrophota bacterium]